MPKKTSNNYKHLLNFLGLPSRPVLTGFHVKPDGTIEATNSHVILRLLKRSTLGVDITIDPKSLEELQEGKYPDTDRFFNHLQPSTTIAFTGKDYEEMFKFAKQFRVKAPETLELRYSYNDDRTTLRAGNGASLDLEAEVTGSEGSILVSSTYLRYVCDFLRDNLDAGQECDCQIVGDLRPIRFTDRNTFDMILMPIRKPKSRWD